MEINNFFKICDGSLDAVKAFTVEKLKVLGNIKKALRFSEIVNNVREQSEGKKTKKKIPENFEKNSPVFLQPSRIF